MEHKNLKLTPGPTDTSVIQLSIARRMLIALCISCIIGMIVMAIIKQTLFVWLFAGIMASALLAGPFWAVGKISIETACVVPILLLCFVYTPLSWFTFNGLLGCTPYLSILFSTIIVLSYYKRKQIILLSLYGALMLGLCAEWIIRRQGSYEIVQVVTNLVAYLLATVSVIALVESVKRKNSEINRRITDLSLHDDLTGLLNHRAIQPVLTASEAAYRERGIEYAVIMMDIDKFKAINDSYGHSLGDSVIRQIADGIRAVVRATDYSIRFGGDEFMLVLSGVDRSQTCEIGRRIQSASCNLPGSEPVITISVGYAMRSEETSSDAVMNLADQRMYNQKKSA